MSKRRQQHKQPKAYYSQGQAVGDKHEQRRNRGESQITLGLLFSYTSCMLFTHC